MRPHAVIRPLRWCDPAVMAATAASADEELAWLDTAACGPTPAARGYSLVACNPVATLEQLPGGPARLVAGGRTLATAPRVWDLLREVHGRLPVLPELPCRLGPGWIGYIGFEAADQLETLPPAPPPILGLPLVRLALYDRVVVFDHVCGTALSIEVPAVRPAFGIAPESEPEAQARANTESAVRRTVSANSAARSESFAMSLACTSGSDWASGSDCASSAYLRRVERALEYIAAGDIYQVNLSQAIAIEGLPDPLATYLAVRESNPSRYAALLSWPGGAIASCSPELFLRVRDGRVRTSPIKGTRPRTGSAARDRAARRALLASAKEAAELAMIVDLHRNDLGRVCRPGSICVQHPRRIEWHPTVLHTVADVTGRLAAGNGPLDLLAACFPAGSISGVPKIRALEIIRELEPHARGAYTGAIGHLGLDGQMTINVAIRTLQIEGRRGVLHVGGGIVADSDPAAEYDETLAKGRGILRGLGLAPHEPGSAARQSWAAGSA